MNLVKTLQGHGVLLALCAATALGTNVSYGFPRYIITPINPVPPHAVTACEGMAPNAGYVVGFEILDDSGTGIEPGYRWQQPGPLVELPVRGFWNRAYAVNDSGHVVGYSGSRMSSIGEAWLWDGTTLTELETPELYWSRANDINNSGLIVGKMVPQFDASDRAVLWRDGNRGPVGTGKTQIGRLLTAAYGVNELGQVVGETDSVVTGLMHAFFWDGIDSDDAVSLPEPSDAQITTAFAVNDLGQAVGSSLLMNYHSTAVFWDTDHSLQVIPPPGGLAMSGKAEAINNAGLVVGEWGEPWIWSKVEGGALLKDLIVGPDLDLWNLVDSAAGAMGIDNKGRIAGEGIYKGEYTSFLLTPITPITIDIKPNSINPKSHGTIPVAILSTQDFDALSQIDPVALTFGQTGFENSLAFCNSHGEDTNGDGLLDLVCHFRTESTGFECGTTEGILSGKTLDGTPVQGSDSVKIVPCR